jgi:hypothetical protein
MDPLIHALAVIDTDRYPDGKRGLKAKSERSHRALPLPSTTRAMQADLLSAPSYQRYSSYQPCNYHQCNDQLPRIQHGQRHAYPPCNQYHLNSSHQTNHCSHQSHSQNDIPNTAQVLPCGEPYDRPIYVEPLTGEVPSALYRFLVIACCCLSLSINADVPPQSPHLLFPQINYSHTAHIFFAQGCTGYAGRGGAHLEATAPISRRQFCGSPRSARASTQHSQLFRKMAREIFVCSINAILSFAGP